MTDLVIASAAEGRIRVMVDVVGGTARSAVFEVAAGVTGRLYAVASVAPDAVHEYSVVLDGTPRRVSRSIPAARRFAVDPWPEDVWVRLSYGAAP